MMLLLLLQENQLSMKLALQPGHNKIAINIMWTLITGFLVMFMQAGFALVETGFTQKKNVAHTMGMNFLGVCNWYDWILDLWFCFYVWRCFKCSYIRRCSRRYSA